MYNPQYSTRSFSLLTFLIGAIGVDQFLFRCGEMFGVLGTSGASISRYQIHQPVMYNPQYSTRSFSLLTFLIGGDWGGPIPFPVRRNVWGVGDQWGQYFTISNSPTFNLYGGNYD